MNARALRPLVALLALAVTTACTKAKGPPKAKGPRIVILGFDGVDPRRVDRMVKGGKLPHIAALAKTGHRGPLATTNPPQSPVAWSAFATGLPAGEHGIFDFINRDPKTYMPKVATTRITHASVDGKTVTPAEAENLRHGPSFWDVIARGGVSVRTHTVPYSYPPPADGAKSLAGLGTPDVRGINSSYTLLTTNKAQAQGEQPAGGQYALLEPMADGGYRAMIQGPRVRVNGARQKTMIPVVVRAAGDELAVDIGGTRQTLAAGQTGATLTVAFTPAPVLTVRAATRITVRQVTPPEVYLEPLSILPADPYLPVSVPPALSQGLWKTIGPFKTVGWVHDTSALGNDHMSETQFVNEAIATMRWREKALLAALDERRAKLTVAVFTAPDRIGHMFYRHIDPVHPARDLKPDPKAAVALDASHVEMDRIIGAVMAKLTDDDVLLVMSDHGFGSFRRGFNLNTWLLRNGYLALKQGVTKPRDFFLDVDWSRTRAYGMGTGSIYLNLKGREGRGIVSPSEAPALAKEIADKVKTVRDGKTRVVLDAYLGDLAFKGARRREAPDIRVGLADGYRASWATTLGGIPAELFEDNLRKWSGDHASARPEDVPGVLFSNKPIDAKDPRIEDLSATAFELTGVARPSGIIGRPLLRAGRAR